MTCLELEAFIHWESLPSLPLQLTRIIDEVGNASSMDYNIVEMIQYDVSIACRVIKLANSSLYGYAGKISSLRQACGLLGLEAIKNIVFTTPVVEYFHDVDHLSQVDFAGVWVNMAVTGVIAEWLGKLPGELEAEVCYTAGLTQGIGKIALAVSQPEKFAGCLAKCKKQNISLEEAETGIFGFSHWHVGLKLATAWGYPAPLIQIFSCQIQPGEAVGGNKLSHTVHLAKFIASQLGYRDGLGPLEKSPPLAVWSGAGLTEDELAKSLPRLEELAKNVARKLTA